MPCSRTALQLPAPHGGFPESVPEIEMPETVTVLPVPTFLLAKVAVVELSVNTSPATRLSDRLTVALVVPSYGLVTLTRVAVKFFGWMVPGPLALVGRI